MAGFGKSFSDAFEKTATVAAAGTLDAIKEKIKLDATKAEETKKVANYLSATAEVVKDADQATQERVGKLIGDSTRSWDEASAKSLFELASSSSKDKKNFQQTLQTEKYKAGTSAVTEVVKSLAERGGYTPEQLQQIQQESANRVASSLGIEVPIEQRISQSSTQGSPQQSNDFFTTPIPQKKTEKQLDRENMLKKGNDIIGSLRDKFNEIDDKYGVGRLQGMMTIGRGALGDILPKEDQAPEVAVYEGLLDGAAVFVGRNVWNDDRVSQDDRGTYKKALAKLTNTKTEGNLMYDALEEFSRTDDPKLQQAIQLMIPHNGKGKVMMPSKALSSVGLLKIASKKDSKGNIISQLYQDRKTGKWLPLENKD